MPRTSISAPSSGAAAAPAKSDRKRYMGIAAGVVIVACVAWMAFFLTRGERRVALPVEKPEQQFVINAHKLMEGREFGLVQLEPLPDGGVRVFGTMPTTAQVEELRRKLKGVQPSVTIDFQVRAGS